MRVEAHVHIGRARKGDPLCVSARTLPTGRVWYTDRIIVEDATFAVQPAGLRRFRETGQKNVHAFVRGHRLGGVMDEFSGEWRPAYYDPRSCDSFLDTVTGEPVHSAPYAALIGRRLYYVKG